MLAECSPECGRFVVLDTMFFAEIADHWLQSFQMAVIHRREQMVLDLHVETAREDVHKITAGCNIMRGDDLVLEVVLIEFFNSIRRQVVDLSGYHEKQRKHVNRDDREE